MDVSNTFVKPGELVLIPLIIRHHNSVVFIVRLGALPTQLIFEHSRATRAQRPPTPSQHALLVARAVDMPSGALNMVRTSLSPIFKCTNLGTHHLAYELPVYCPALAIN